MVPDSLSWRPDLLACLPGPTGAYACDTPAVQQCLTAWLTCVDHTLSVDDVLRAARHALAAYASLTHLLCPKCHASILDTVVPNGKHRCHACAHTWPRTTGMPWGNPLARLAPELVDDQLHVRMLPSVLHTMLATLTSATLLPSFLE